MKEAYGGILNIVFIVVFLVIIIGILGLVFSYTKAFKMKNAIIATFEEYEGSGCGAAGSTACQNKIRREARDLAFNPASLNCGSQGFNDGGIYCYKIVSTHAKTINGKSNTYVTYRILVKVDIDFPIVEHIAGFRMFEVAGDTREIMIRS